MPKRCLIHTCSIILSLASISCVTKNQILQVDKFTLRTIKLEGSDTAMVRGDQQKRLYGAVTINEHKQRIGQYYLLRWNLNHTPTYNTAPTPQITFKYKQASTGAKIKTASHTFPKGTRKGKWPFNNIGKNYLKGGRILAWRAELTLDGQLIDSKESFLWSK